MYTTFHARPLVVRDVLHPDELEHIVELTPVLEDPLRPVDAEPRPGSRCHVPSFGGAGNGPPSAAGTSAAFISVPLGLRPVAMFFGTWMNSPVIDAGVPVSGLKS